VNRFYALVLAVVLICPAVGFSQKKKADQTRSVQGTVSGADDSIVNGARVYLENTKTLQVRTFYTKEDGAYYFHELSPDVDYKLRAEFNGATSATKTLSSFDTRKEAVLNLKLNKK